MFLGFLPWTLFESLRELGDWWAFCDELESFEKKQNKLNAEPEAKLNPFSALWQGVCLTSQSMSPH